MKIQRVASYRTTDGKTFSDKKDAQTHQKTLDRLDELEALIRDRLQLQDEGDLRGYTARVLAETLLENADALRGILPQRAKSDPDAIDALIAEQQAALGQTPATVQ